MDQNEPQSPGLIDRAERARAIARGRAQGLTWQALGDLHGVTPRHARRLVTQVQDSGDREAAAALLSDRPAAPGPRASEDEVLDAEHAHPFVEQDVWSPIRRLLDAVEWSAAVMRSEASADTPNSGRVRAARNYVETEMIRVKLYATCGALPADPARFFRAEEGRVVMRRVIDRLRAQGVDPAAISDAFEAILGSDSDHRSTRAPEAHDP